VNTATGNFWHTFDDLDVAGRGPGLQLSRTYNSLDAAHLGWFGYGWSSSYEVSLTVTGSTAVARRENGSQTTFTQTSPGTWDAPARAGSTLRSNADGTWTLTCHGTRIYTFESTTASTHRLTAIADPNGYTTTVSYSSSTEVDIRDNSQRLLTLTVNGSGRVTAATDPATPARTVSYSYTGDDLTDVIDAAGGDTRFTYDNHLLRTMLDPNQTLLPTAQQHPVANVYDTQGRVTMQTDYAGADRVTHFDYTAVPGSTVVTDPSGNTDMYTYTSGVLSALTRGYGTASAQTWVFQVDPVTGATAVATDPNGHQWRATYDFNGNQLSSTDPLGHTATTTYNAFNEPVVVTDPTGVQTTYGYDNNGTGPNVVSKTVAHGSLSAVSTYRYGENGADPHDLTSMSDPDHTYVDATSPEWKYTYDGYGDRTSVTDPVGNKTRSCFNSIGWPTAVISPVGSAAPNSINCLSSGIADHTAPFTTYDAQYTPFGDLASVIDPDGHTLQRSYDADRNVVQSTDGNGNATRYLYDTADQLVESDPAYVSPSNHGPAQLTGYWPDGTVQSQTDGAGNVTSYTYTPLGQLQSVTTPPTAANATGGTTVYSYDPAGNQVTKQDPGGSCAAQTGCTTSYYDADNRVTGVDYSDPATPDIKGSTGFTNGVTYDNLGRRLTLTQTNGVDSSWSYDDLGRLETSDDGTGAVTYDHDLRGNTTTIIYPGNKYVWRHFDDAGRLDYVIDPNLKITTFGYDANSNMDQTNFYTDQPSPAAGQVDSYGFDNADRLSRATLSMTGTTWLNESYSRDGVGQPTYMDYAGSSLAGGHATFGYNALNQLTTGASAPWSYDPAGNLTKVLGVNQAFDPADQLCYSSPTTAADSDCADSSPTSPGDATVYSYDSRGNRTGIDQAVGLPSTFGYDQADRLTAAQVPTLTKAQGQYTPVPSVRVLDTVAASHTSNCYAAGGTCTQIPAGGTLVVGLARAVCPQPGWGRRR
jgi:YD repeat-containing protein